jgi:hypothetical protein
LPTDKRSYVAFDAAGLAEVRCMDCACVMKRRVLKKIAVVDAQKNFLGYQTDQDGNALVVPHLVRTPKYHEQHIALSDGSFARIFRCVDCCQVPLDHDKLTRQIKLAWMEEMTACEKTLAQRKHVLKSCEHIKVTGEHSARQLL